MNTLPKLLTTCALLATPIACASTTERAKTGLDQAEKEMKSADEDAKKNVDYVEEDVEKEVDEKE